MPIINSTKEVTKTLLFIVLLLIAIVFLAWMGISFYGNFFGRDDGIIEAPDPVEAAYAVYMKATNRVIYTDDYEMVGDAYLLHGWYNLEDDKFIWNDGDLKLDPNLWGQIEVRRR